MAQPISQPVAQIQSQGAVALAPEPHFAYDFLKRFIDIVGAALTILLLLPVLIGVSIALWLTCGLPVFFVQRRLGQGGAEFGCWKFRTMIRDAESRRAEVLHLNTTGGPTFKHENDPRVTRFGKFLRRTSLDELPQLWNVLRGDMSLVGPRPLPLIENRYHGAQMQRLSVKPGITCTWQVSGRSKVTFQEWMEMDLAYVERRTLVKDLWLLVRTVPAVLSGRGAV